MHAFVQYKLHRYRCMHAHIYTRIIFACRSECIQDMRAGVGAIVHTRTRAFFWQACPTTCRPQRPRLEQALLIARPRRATGELADAADSRCGGSAARPPLARPCAARLRPRRGPVLSTSPLRGRRIVRQIDLRAAHYRSSKWFSDVERMRAQAGLPRTGPLAAGSRPR